MTHRQPMAMNAPYVRPVRAGREVISVRRRRGLAVQGLPRRIQRTDSTIHRGDRAARTVLRSSVFGVAPQTLCHRGDPAEDPFAVEGIIGPRHLRAAATRAGATYTQSEHVGARHARRCAVGSLGPGRETGVRPDLGDAGKGVRPLAGERRICGRVWPQHVWAVMSRGAAVGRKGSHTSPSTTKAGIPQGSIFQTMRRKLPELDKGLAMLLQDLSDHGLLDSTIVWCCVGIRSNTEIQWEAPWNGRTRHGAYFSTACCRRRIQGRPRCRGVGMRKATGEGTPRVSG